MFCFAETRALEERMLARASVEASLVEERSVLVVVVPLEGDIVV